MSLDKLPYPKRFSKIWYNQRGEWDCGLASLRIALRYLSLDLNERSMVKIIKGLGLKLFDWGIYISYLPLIASEIGLNSRLKIKLSDAGFIKNKKGLIDLFTARLNDPSKTKERYYLYKSLLTCVSRGIEVKVYVSKHRPNIDDLMGSLKAGNPAIVLIRAKEYYITEDDWNHMVTLVPSKKGFVALDPYLKRGYKHYVKWDSHIKHSLKYDWDRWTGDMVEIFHKGEKTFMRY